MRAELVRHPDFPCDAVRAIEAQVEPLGPGMLAVRFVVAGDLGRLRLQPAAAPERTDELWRTTCLEAFAADAEGDGYTEYNLAPSTRWAAYRFEGYRRGLHAAEVGPPGIVVERTAGGLDLRARLDLARPASRLGLAAVIEETSGRISYWAARHPAGRPDFHHADGFALELPPPSGA
ncbi:DOMON-like domain-containing protein [Phenylobacterium sp.]|uniref:DOMON-like domain-containing protein n=1 Tax=Phenylobacterium sp. TaxID=1871053 RepID=UPI0025FB246F|nr:DOMON-like domain-containing protein [Phenylobacterium sp.]MBX3486231.1 DOMON-like domain-containing protein [Phenylobacterium sp.]MCW5760211.1 DOMON-like domain-containing protein [Phenylobacterium sp.]